MTDPAGDLRIQSIQRPDPALWKYYLLKSLSFPPFFPIVVIPMYFRYHTMRYKFGDDGISMSWGIIFRHETIVNYARIQDIHLKSNIIERWLGLCRILIQTASGSDSAELTIEGIKEYELLRDFLYARMRGVKDVQTPSQAQTHSPPPNSSAAAPADELTLALREAVNELRAIRTTLEQRQPITPEDSRHV